MFNNFSEETKKVITVAKKEMLELKHPYLGSEHIMLGILKTSNDVSNALKNINLDYNKYRKAVIDLVGLGEQSIEYVLYTPIVKEIFERAVDISTENGSDVSIENLFVALIEIGDGIATRVLNNLNINLEKIYTEFIFKIPKKNKKKKTIIEEIGFEFTSESAVKGFDPVYGRDKEIKQIVEILIRKNKSNPLLIGDAGVGKSAIVEEISRRIVKNQVPNKLKNKKIINIDMSSAVAGTKYRGEFEEKINKIIKEAEANDDIIIFIDEIHTIVGAGGAEGAIDASNIFKPALARGKIKCIGATTYDEYKKYIEKDKALERRFKKVLINEPTKEQTKDIIHKLKKIYENYHHVSMNNNILDLLITLTDKYIKEHKNPDKTIDILDEVCAHANLKENKKMQKHNELNLKLNKIANLKQKKIINKNFKEALKLKQEENRILSQINEIEWFLTTNNYINVTKKDLEEVLKNKVDVPIIELNNKINYKKIINELNSRIIGQSDPVDKLVNSYISSLENNHVHSILLSGNSGVGKTYLAEQLAKVLSCNELKLNMSEFSEAHSISKLIGAPPGYVGYENADYIFDKIRKYPFSIVILDEIEKCHDTVLNLIFQILDNDEIKDSKGNTIYFNNCIIIMTTNVNKGKCLGFKGQNTNSKLNEYFTNDFTNRICDTIVLNDLSKYNIIKIIEKEMSNTKVELSADHALVSKILNECDYEKAGARKIKYIISKIVRDKKIKKYCKNYSKN